MPYAKLIQQIYWHNNRIKWKLLLAFMAIAIVFGGHVLSMKNPISPGKSLVKLYPTPRSATTSSNYTVVVNGKPVFVQKYNSLSYAQFAFAGRANIEIQVKEKVKKYTLSPKSYKLKSQHQGNKISLSLAVPRKLILHQVNSLDEQLFIFAEPLEEKAPQLSDNKVISITQYQVDNTGEQDATTKIQTAIDQVAARSGILYFPPGIYKIAQLNLKSNLTLYLAPGAVLEATTEVYPSYGKGLIQIENAKNVKIMGRGTINGNGSYWRSRGGWYSLILLKNTRNIRLQDILIQDPAVANVWISYADGVRIDNVKILANPEPEFLNTDGFDFWSARNITINNVLYKGTDDATSHGGDMKGKIQNNENINVTNAIFYGGNGFKIGSTTKQKLISNITYENIDVVYANELSGFWPMTGANFENIYFKNIRVEDILDVQQTDKSAGLFQWRIQAAKWEPESSPEKLGYIKNVYVQNLKVDDRGGAKSIFQGYDNRRDISNITFDNLHIQGKKALNPQDAYFDIQNPYVDLKFTSSNPTIVNIKATKLYGSASGNVGKFQITRTGKVNKPLTVKYRIRGTADNGKDYQTIPNTVEIKGGQHSAVITIRPKRDSQRQRLKTVLLSLENQPHSTNYMLGPDFQGVVNIRD
ncbi:MAG: glycosyl hydrolase family 28 protein [Calothrix sp. MO_167.B42]|nr:glycosyl hydrolase family 28 protein [Calothrix sp. MO_167.B42]